MYSLTQNPFQFAPSTPTLCFMDLFLFLFLPLLPIRHSPTCCSIFSVFNLYLFWLSVSLFYLLCTPVPLRVFLPSPSSCPSSPQPLRPDKAGFGNNFTTGDNKSVAQNMEAVVVGCMFKSLITRCASTTHELHSPENLVSDPSLLGSLAPQPARRRHPPCCHSACQTHGPTHQLPPEKEKQTSHSWEYYKVTTVLFDWIPPTLSFHPLLHPPLLIALFPLCITHPLHHPRPVYHHSFSSCLRPSSSSPPPPPPPPQGLYCDIRQLVQFIKEAHGNVFRRVALSALLDSAEKVTATKKPEEKEESKQGGTRR